MGEIVQGGFGWWFTTGVATPNPYARRVPSPLVVM
jgi:hypothetical protein